MSTSSTISPSPIGNSLNTSPTASVNLASHTGPVLLGGYLAWGLFGMLSIQVYTYYQSFPKDKLWTKTLVYAVYLLLFMHAVFITHNGFRIFAYGFGDLDELDHIGTLWIPFCIIEGIVAFLVQSFYAWRIFIISGRKYPTFFILALSLFSFAWAIVVGAHGASEGRFSKVVNKISEIEAGMWEGSAALCDIMISVLMAYYLRRRVPVGDRFKSTADIVNKLVRLSIETGSLTATAAIILLATVYLSGNARAYYACPTAIVPGLYSTALLAVLNSRASATASCNHSTTCGGPHTSNKPISIQGMFRQAQQATNSDGSVSVTDNIDVTFSAKSTPTNKTTGGENIKSTTPCSPRQVVSWRPDVHYIGP